MRPNLHPRLVNGRFGDPALFVEMLHRREALLFDAGDLSRLSTRDLLRVGHLFITHMHMDHFIGFDALLRVNVGREKLIRVIGPPGTIERVGHKLKAYDWDLVERYQTELVFEIVEIDRNRGSRSAETPALKASSRDAGEDHARSSSIGCHAARAAKFRFKRAFELERIDIPCNWDRPAGLKLKTALLEHHGACLGFAVSEPAHINVWKSRLDEEGLATGPWLQSLKDAVLRDAPAHEPIEMPDHRRRPLGELRHLVTVTKGQKIAYVTDVSDTRMNRAGIVELARSADLFFIEARFAAADVEAARERAHLTTIASGEIACAAEVRRLEPFHFSQRYEGDEERMLKEVFEAFDQCREALALSI